MVSSHSKKVQHKTFSLCCTVLAMNSLSDDLSGGVEGVDLIDYEDGYVAPNMSYVPEGLDEQT